MNDWLLYLVPGLGIIGIIVMLIKSQWVSKQDAGDANMKELAGHIADGAMSFLKAEWKVMSYFVIIAGCSFGIFRNISRALQSCYCHFVCYWCCTFRFSRIYRYAHCNQIKRKNYSGGQNQFG